MLRSRVRTLALAAAALASAVLVVVSMLARKDSPPPPEPVAPIATQAPDEDDAPRLDPRRPPGTWRPYSAESPFNQPLPENPRLDPRSDRMVAKLFSDGPPDTLLTFDGTDEDERQDDFARPIYFARDGDPSYRVRCVDPAFPCRAGGDVVRIPEEARAAGGSDGHLTVVDAGTTRVVLLPVQGKPRRGEIAAVNGARTSIGADGIDVGGGAARVRRAGRPDPLGAVRRRGPAHARRCRPRSS